MNYANVQRMAKETIRYAEDNIRPGMTLAEVRRLCEEKLLALGADSFWYWGIGAMCFAGDETTVSVSGRNYVTSGRVIAENDIITIDLSPQVKGLWGDYARTIILEDGKAVRDVKAIRHPAWRAGLLMEEELHAEMQRIAVPDMTFEELAERMNAFIIREGYINLDFHGNLGHSIEKRSEDRIYLEPGNKAKLSDAAMFTFEPHISTAGSCYGYKKENIYFFEDGVLKEL